VTVAGIDFSTNAVDVVLLALDDNTAVWHHVDLTTGPGDALERCRRIRDLMPTRGRWEDAGIIAVGIEQPLHQKGRTTVASLFRVQGAIIACLPTRVLVDPLPPTVWKTAIGLPGNALKAAVRAWALAHWTDPPDPVTQDACDAYAIATATRARIERQEVDAA
jgi:Holliday junction resolvasome RuvABC endonuclease subunit